MKHLLMCRHRQVLSLVLIHLLSVLGLLGWRGQAAESGLQLRPEPSHFGGLEFEQLSKIKVTSVSRRESTLQQSPAAVWNKPENRTNYVQDNGVGFDLAYASKLFGVFQRFHRVGSTKAPAWAWPSCNASFIATADGSGPELNHTAARHFILPSLPSPSRTLPHTHDDPPEPMPQAETVEILLVEDNPNDVELMLRAMRRHNLANHIHVARDGLEALDSILCREPYENRQTTPLPKLVLLDLKLPLVDGFEVLRQIRATPRTSSLPVVVLTSSATDPDIASCYALGATSYIVKPVDFDKFIETARLLGMYWLLLNRPPPASCH